ncbi:alpha/beta hydrolase [Aureimonas ureilytica]|uniref:alpha/beta hydrolase n=1 Tax=Aureimonas ureilytica TaxID=401562 RepID=UPI000362B32C|nr:alpha/beta hydrolase-fold protein [Aureimonas ureilytica]
MTPFQPSLQPVGLAETQFFDLPSAIEAGVWRIFVHIPSGPVPEDGWPLLAITDGNAMIATAVETLRLQGAHPGATNVTPGVVVAIGYPGPGTHDPLRRAFDLSPPPGRTYPPFTPDGPPVLTGGARRFLDVLENEVLPIVERLAPLHATRRTLFGHSFGGLFALYALFEGTRSFTRFVAASPTIYWEDAILLEAERRFVATFVPEPERKIVVHLGAGEFEGDALAPFQLDRDDTQARLAKARLARTLDLTHEMAMRLQMLPDFRVHYERYGNETHMSVLPIAVSRALRTAFENHPA